MTGAHFSSASLCVLQRYVCRDQLRTLSRRAGPPQVPPSIVVFPNMFLESLFFLGAFVFLFWWSVVWRASRPGPLRFVSFLWSAFGKVPDAQRHQLGHMGYSPYPDVSGIRLVCDSVRTSDAQHGLYRCRALQHSAFSYDHVPDHGHLHRGGERGDSSVPSGTRDRGEDSGATSNSVGV